MSQFSLLQRVFPHRRRTMAPPKSRALQRFDLVLPLRIATQNEALSIQTHEPAHWY